MTLVFPSRDRQGAVVFTSRPLRAAIVRAVTILLRSLEPTNAVVGKGAVTTRDGTERLAFVWFFDYFSEPRPFGSVQEQTNAAAGKGAVVTCDGTNRFE